MKVIIDGRWRGDTGIGRVYREVLSRKPADIDIELIQDEFPLGSPFSPFYLSNRINSTATGKFYSPSFMPPFSSRIPFVITIHDLNHLYYYSIFHKYYLKYFIAHLAKRASKIITVSQFTKTELVDKLKIDADNIKVVYNGIDPIFFENKSPLKLDRPYFLYVGNRRKYKNITRMLKAFALSAIPKDYILIMSGFSDPLLIKEIEELNLTNRVKFFGPINENDLPSLYKGATGVIFVSLMEGFGLPLLEAMASGTPVITSNVTSLPEVAGDAALLVDPLDIRAIAKGIESLVNDIPLRNSLVNLGYRRANKFNWSATADQTWDIIRT